MKIAEGVEMLQLTTGSGQTFNAALIWDEADVVLIDAGLPNMQAEIQLALEKLGIPFSRLNKIIATHHDRDHLGSIPEILAAAAQQISVLAHEKEKAYIQGEEHLLAKIEKSIKALPPAQQEERRQAYLNRQTVKVNNTLVDGQELPYCGGIIVIHTPGHTPGHICLYHIPSKTLITGDSIVAKDGKLLGPDPIFTLDMAEAKASLKKLLPYEIKQIICYHGGLVSDGVKKQLQELTLS
ncbi:MAG: MBL fold metallo-hydrolase [Firmicutes bacterium]|nr:MBL fold metallo-hydrolase [Bacillota bacterium]